MCLFTRLVENRKYRSNKKNGGVVPAVPDSRVYYVAVGCGECIECRKQKAREWQVRLLEDVQENRNGKFVTLTFSNEKLREINADVDERWQGYERDNRIAILAVRRFLERWRKKYKKSVRHWLITELGHNGTENIHLHGIIWTDKTMEEIEERWDYGWIWKGNMKNGKRENYVTARTVNYIIKYVHKRDEKHKYYKSKILTSAGIGGCYTEKKIGNWLKNKFNGEKTIETYRTETGHKIAMPTYWRNKIYTDDEREKLWLQKLDKQERWVCGEKVDISNGDTEYWKLVRWYRRINTELGYGNGDINWNRKEYEEQRRKMMQGARLRT